MGGEEELGSRVARSTGARKVTWPVAVQPLDYSWGLTWLRFQPLPATGQDLRSTLMTNARNQGTPRLGVIAGPT